MSQGFDDFLGKPFKREALLELIGRHLDLQYNYVDKAADKSSVKASLTEESEYKASSIKKINQAHKSRVLIVDDVKPNRMLLTKLLSAEEYDCHEAGNGNESLALIDEWQPDIVLLDIQMPEMDGYEVLRQVDNAALPIIVVTAEDEPEERIRLENMGAVAVFTKPIKSEKLKAFIRQQLV